ncbi:hypothetical protein ACFL02_07210 [Planctomycetota bacterium]
MRFWNWLIRRSSSKPKKGKSRKTLDPKIRQAFTRVKGDIKKLKSVLATISGQLEQHDRDLAENTQFIHHNITRLDKLEEIVTAAPVIPSEQISPINRPKERTNRLVATKIPEANPVGMLDMTSLSLQEKRILGVFLAHRDMALSYGDIAKYLNKSPHTIKNQIRQLSMKATLLDKTVDDKNKNRFRLKKQLKIETELGDY